VPVFPSKEWCAEAIRLANADPEITTAGAGWTGDFGVVVLAEPGKLAKTFAIHLEPKNGRVERWSVLRDPDELEEIEPAYLAQAPYSTWKGLIQGTLDPVEATLKRQINVKGDLQPLIERMKYKGIAARVMSLLSTEFADEKK
jgi:putative sterol carrier protein